MADVESNKELRYAITTTASLSSPTSQLNLLAKLGPDTVVNPDFEVPFEFDVLDTPNKGVAVATTKVALAAEELNKGISVRNLDLIRQAKTHLEEGIAGMPPETDDTMLPPMIRKGWIHNIDTLILLSEIKAHVQPPLTLTIDQFKSLRGLLFELYRVASRVVAGTRWRNDVLGWTKIQTMRIVAHHLAFALGVEMQKLGNHAGPIISTETIAKRQSEILSLLEQSGFTEDTVYLQTKEDFVMGYRMSLGDYHPIMVDQINDGSLFARK